MISRLLYSTNAPTILIERDDYCRKIKWKKLDLIKRIFKTQVKTIFITNINYFYYLLVVSALATASVAWLLDPAIKKIFIEKNKTLLFVIPGTNYFSLFIVKSICNLYH